MRNAGRVALSSPFFTARTFYSGSFRVAVAGACCSLAVLSPAVFPYCVELSVLTVTRITCRRSVTS